MVHLTTVSSSYYTASSDKVFSVKRCTTMRLYSHLKYKIGVLTPNFPRGTEEATKNLGKENECPSTETAPS
jgi:hypothetical protein